jgi:hypothetical protein
VVAALELLGVGVGTVLEAGAGDVELLVVRPRPVELVVEKAAVATMPAQTITAGA